MLALSTLRRKPIPTSSFCFIANEQGIFTVFAGTESTDMPPRQGERHQRKQKLLHPTRRLREIALELTKQRSATKVGNQMSCHSDP